LLSKSLKLWELFTVELQTNLSTQVDQDVLEVEDLTIQLIEAFCGRRIDSFLAEFHQAVITVSKDKELYNFLDEFRHYLYRGLDNPDIIDSDKYLDEGDALVKKGRAITWKYREDSNSKEYRNFQRLFDELYEIVYDIRTDEIMKEMQSRSAAIVKDLTYKDEKGNVRVDTDLIARMRTEIIPFVLSRVNEIPIPSIKTENEDFEYLEIDGMSIHVKHILPENIVISSQNDTAITMQNLLNPTSSDSIIKFKIEGIKPRLDNVHFRFKRRGKIMGIKDDGIADVRIRGRGIHVYVDFRIINNATTKRPMLEANKSSVFVDDLKIKIKEAEHKALLSIATSLFGSRIKAEIEKAVAERLALMSADWATLLNEKILTNIPTLGETLSSGVTGVKSGVTGAKQVIVP